MRRPSIPVLAGAVVLALVAAVLAVVLVGRGDGGSSGGGDAGGTRSPATPDPTTLAELATAAPVVRRDAFCDAVATRAAPDALAGEVADETQHANGDTTTLDATTTDVAHEWGCRWTSTTGSSAEAWVFAPPVTRGRANRLARAATRAKGCASYDDGQGGFGDPGTAWTCTTADLVIAGRAGLFGDAWLTCTVSDPATAVTGAAGTAALQARADRWCVDVALAADGS